MLILIASDVKAESQRLTSRLQLERGGVRRTVASVLLAFAAPRSAAAGNLRSPRLVKLDQRAERSP